MNRSILTFTLVALVAMLCFGTVALASDATDEPLAPEQETTEVESPDADADADEGSAVKGTAESDVFEGSDADERYNGHAGDDTIAGGAGDDVLRGGSGADAVDGGEGNDRIRGGKGEDSLDGGDGDDRINARGDGRSGDVVTCGDGVDNVKLGRGDTIADASEESPMGSCEEVKGLKAPKARGHKRAACEAGVQSATRGGQPKLGKREKCKAAKRQEDAS